MTDPYGRLRSLLEEQEKFPTDFTHKFIGKNTLRFTTGVQRLEEQFPALRLEKARTSSGEAHLALTYILRAENADEIIAVLEATGKIEDLHLVL